MYAYMCVCVYIYIYIERESEAYSDVLIGSMVYSIMLCRHACRKGEMYEQEGFKDFRSKFGPKSFGLHHRCRLQY